MGRSRLSVDRSADCFHRRIIFIFGIKMTWNYRIVKITTKDSGEKLAYPWYGLFEVYYNSKKQPYTRTVDPTTFVGDEGHEVVEAIGMAFNDALKYDILDDGDIKEEYDRDFDQEGK